MRQRNTLTRAKGFRRFNSPKTAIKFIESLLNSAFIAGLAKAKLDYAPPRMKHGFDHGDVNKSYSRMIRIAESFAKYLHRAGLV